MFKISRWCALMPSCFSIFIVSQLDLRWFQFFKIWRWCTLISLRFNVDVFPMDFQWFPFFTILWWFTCISLRFTVRCVSNLFSLVFTFQNLAVVHIDFLALQVLLFSQWMFTGFQISKFRGGAHWFSCVPIFVVFQWISNELKCSKNSRWCRFISWCFNLNCFPHGFPMIFRFF